jgi:hypothetical protein
MDNQTPETIRTAAYLAARERLDARKTTRNVQCNPPNVRCGNRCIPPSWDCRLKGQGTDPHLRAVKTDPLGGLANIQRGFGRISRGVVRGNFSEVEGGKRAIIRGTVKITPGNIQQKKELQKKLENRTRAIGMGLAVVTGGLGIHALLMKNNTFGYRNGLGNDINSATRAGISRVLDALPLVGAQRARTRGSVAGAVGEAAVRATTEQAAGPAALRATLGTGGESVLAATPIASQNVAAAGKLTTDLNRVDREFASGSGNVYTWNQRHREAFWNSTTQEAGVGGGRDTRFSIFARPAAEEHLGRQYNLTADERLTTRSIKDALTARIETERGDLIALAKQQGYRVSRVGGRETINESDLGPFMRGVVRTSGGSTGFTPAIRREVESHLEGVLTKSATTYTNTLYSRTVQGFNDFYREVGDIARNTAGASALDPALRQRGYGEILGAADQTRARYLAGRMRMTRPIAGQAHAELVGNAYFATRVAGRANSTYSVTDRLAVSAASELAGRDVTSPTEAFRLLTGEYGFTGATRVRAPRTETTRTTPVSTGQTRPARRRLRSRSEIIAMLTRGSNPLSPEAAAAEADRIIANRGDEDDFSPELVRTATYLAARADFKEAKRLGKPCGASHIPKAHECTKGQGDATKEASPESGKPSRLGQKIALATVAAAIGAVGVTVALDAHRFYNSKDLPNPPGYREAIRAAQAGDPKVGYDVAIGRHYDKVVSEEGWKPGQLVYTRYGSGSDKKDPTGHFAVYMGKNGDRHQFADFGVRSTSAREGEVNLYEYGPGSKGVAPFVFVKAPPLKRGTESFSPEQIQQRVFSSLGARMKYDALDNNCETWARMITTGQARSAQVERLSVLTRGLYRFYDRKTAGALPKDIPSVKQQARILDMQALAASGDKSARANLKAFQALIKQGKRTDGMQQDTESELPTPAQLLRAATSDVDALIRTKLYLMLLIRQGEARAYGPA